MSASSRLRRIAQLLAKGVGIILLGLVGLVLLVFISLDLPPVRAFIVKQANSALASSFQGRLVLRRLGQLDVRGVGGVDLELQDPKGATVLRAYDAKVTLAWPSLAYRAITGADPLRVQITGVTVKELRVLLIDDGTGSPTLARAFEPKEQKPDEPGGAATIVVVDDIKVESARIHGWLASPGAIDLGLSRLRAQLRNDPAATQIELSGVELEARRVPQVEHVRGRLRAGVHLPAEPKAADRSRTSAEPKASKPALRATADFSGDVAGSAVALQARLSGEAVNGSLEIALKPATVSKLVSGLSPRDPAAVLAKVEGQLSDLRFEANVTQQPMSLKLKGRLQNHEGRAAIDARLDAEEVDLARWLESAPATLITLGADARLQFENGSGGGNYRVVLSPESSLPPHLLPETTVDGELSLPQGQAPLLSGTVQIAEPGAPTSISYSVRAEPAGVVAQVTATSQVQAPKRLKALSGGLSATGNLELAANFNGAEKRLDAALRAHLRDVRHPAAAVRSLTLEANARGEPSAPRLQFDLRLGDVTAADRRLERVRLQGSGTPQALALNARIEGRRPDSIDLRTTLSPAGKQLLQATHVAIEDRGTRIEVGADSVSVAEGRVVLQKLTLEGAGRLEASLSYGRTLEQLELSAQALEPVKLLRAFGVETPLEDGKVDLALTFANRGQAKGKVQGAARELKYGKLDGGTARIDLALERSKLSGEIGMQLGPGASARIRMKELDAPLPPLTEQKLAGISGELTLDGDIDLGKFRPVFPIAGIERADGQVRFDVAFERHPTRKRSPSLRAQLLTKQLIVVGQRTGTGKTQDAERAEDAQPFTIRGIDLDLNARLDDRGAGITGKLTDSKGELVTLNAEWQGIAAERDLFRPLPALMNSPFVARTHVPARALEKLPAPIRPKSIRGTLALDVEAKGTLARPEVKARGTLVRFGPATEKEDPRGLDLMLDAEYAPKGGALSLRADGRTRDVVVLQSRWQGNIADVAKGSGARSPIIGDTKLALNEFPVGAIPTLRDRGIRGRLSGRAELSGLGENARFELELETRKLRVERMMLDRIQIKAQTQRDSVALEASIEGAGGRAGAKLSTGIDWGPRLVPILGKNLEGSAFAQNLRLATIQPLVAGSVSELDGRLNAQIRAKLTAGKPELSGKVSLVDGALQLPSIGQRFHDIQTEVHVTPDSIRVDNLRGRGSSGAFRADAKAQMQGLTPVAVNAALHIDEDDKLPLTMEGETIGDVWGTIEARYRHLEAAKTNEIKIDVKKLSIELPDAAPQGIQDLSQDPRIRVGFRRNDERFAEIALQPIEEPKPPSDEKTVVNVHLGNVFVRKGQQAKVTLGGDIRAELGEKLDVRGSIETRRGTLDISGKQFEIERGSVSFNGGEPDNPTISAVARYDSPAGYTVYAEYTGTAKVGKLRLSSDPPLSQDEILTLLMFGSPEGSFGAGSGDSLSTAVGVAGGTAAKGLNRALSDVTDLDVSARIDTSTGAPRPELVVQLSSRVAARVTQALGEPTPGQSPDRTFLTVEFRFARAWSLSTMVGDKGASALDLIWRKRY